MNCFNNYTRELRPLQLEFFLQILTLNNVKHLRYLMLDNWCSIQMSNIMPLAVQREKIFQNKAINVKRKLSSCVFPDLTAIAYLKWSYTVPNHQPILMLILTDGGALHAFDFMSYSNVVFWADRRAGSPSADFFLIWPSFGVNPLHDSFSWL